MRILLAIVAVVALCGSAIAVPDQAQTDHSYLVFEDKLRDLGRYPFTNVSADTFLDIGGDSLLKLPASLAASSSLICTTNVAGIDAELFTFVWMYKSRPDSGAHTAFPVYVRPIDLNELGSIGHSQILDAEYFGEADSIGGGWWKGSITVRRGAVESLVTLWLNNTNAAPVDSPRVELFSKRTY